MARYIDVEEITRRIVYYYGHTNEGSGERYAYGIALKEIDRTPTADVEEVKHAHWREGRFLKVGDSVKGYPSVICSDCGITFCDIINSHNYMYRYCPNCGAKMDGGEAE